MNNVINFQARILDAKEVVFRDQYLLTLKAEQSALTAGYAKATARSKSHLWVSRSRQSCPVSKLHVWDAVDESLSEISEKAQVDAVWVLEQARQLFERCMVPEPILDRKGNPTGVYKFDCMGALKALEMIGRHAAVQAFVSK